MWLCFEEALSTDWLVDWLVDWWVGSLIGWSIVPATWLEALGSKGVVALRNISRLTRTQTYAYTHIYIYIYTIILFTAAAPKIE